MKKTNLGEKKRSKIELQIREKTYLLKNNEITKIINGLNINEEYEILVTSDTMEMSMQLMLRDIKISHDDIGRREIKETGKVLLGNAKFGINRQYEIYQKGKRNKDESKRKDELPYFKDSQKLVVVISKYVYSNMEESDKEKEETDKEVEETKNRIIIYIPRQLYKNETFQIVS